MKKKVLPLLLLAPLGVCCFLGEEASQSAIEAMKIHHEAALTSDAIYSSVHDFFNSYYEIDTVCSIPLQISGYLYDVKAEIVDKVSKDSRYNNYALSYTVANYSAEMAEGEFFYTADDDGYVVENYISIANKIEEREVTDTSGNQVEFLGNYNSPFYYLALEDSGDFSSYFEITAAEGLYSLSLTDAGYDLIGNSFNNFFNQFTYKYLANFDSKTHRQEIKNIVIELDENCLPSSMSFNRVESDFYGAIVESYSCEFVALDEVPSLNKVEGTLSDEQKEYFDTQVSALNSSAFTPGNFTQTTTVNDWTANSDYTALVKEEYTYHNFYDASNKIMLSDYEAYDSTYGLTYISAYYYADSSLSDAAYTLIGITPSEGFYGTLSSSYPTFDSISEFAPTLGVSSDFFTYSESGTTKTYTFDISKFNYADYYFSLDLLESILGQADPCVIIGNFVADSDYNFDFSSLVYEFDESDNLTITLNYQGYYGFSCSFSTEYSAIGTTDVITLSETNDAVKDCLAILTTSE